MFVVFRQNGTTCFTLAAAGRYPYTGALGLLGERDKEVVQASLDRVNAGEIAERPFSAISDGQRCEFGSRIG